MVLASPARDGSVDYDLHVAIVDGLHELGVWATTVVDESLDGSPLFGVDIQRSIALGRRLHGYNVVLVPLILSTVGIRQC